MPESDQGVYGVPAFAAALLCHFAWMTAELVCWQMQLTLSVPRVFVQIHLAESSATPDSHINTCQAT
jgi:hypothetical protein